MTGTNTPPSAVLKRARDCARQGNHAQTLELLNAIPEDSVTDPIEVGAVATAKQHALLMCASASADATYRLALFFRAQAAFYRAIYVYPFNREAYHLHTAFWHLLGRSDMAVRLLRNLACSAPDEETQRLIETYGSTQSVPQGSPESPPSKGDLGGVPARRKTPPLIPPQGGTLAAHRIHASKPRQGDGNSTAGFPAGILGRSYPAAKRQTLRPPDFDRLESRRYFRTSLLGEASVTHVKEIAAVA